MDAVVRRKLEMATRVRAFSRAHPFTDASYSVILTRFEERLGKAETLAALQRAGQTAIHQATIARIKLRQTLHHEILHHIETVAELALKNQPILAARFKLPSPDGTNHAYLAAARMVLIEAQARRQLLIEHGLKEAVLDHLELALLQLEATTATIHGSRANDTAARTDLRMVVTELGMLVGLLDGLNRHRFRDDTAILAEWNIARNVLGPATRKASTVGGDGETHDPPKTPGRAAA